MSGQRARRHRGDLRDPLIQAAREACAIIGDAVARRSLQPGAATIDPKLATAAGRCAVESDRGYGLTEKLTEPMCWTVLRT